MKLINDELKTREVNGNICIDSNNVKFSCVHIQVIRNTVFEETYLYNQDHPCDEILIGKYLQCFIVDMRIVNISLPDNSTVIVTRDEDTILIIVRV